MARKYEIITELYRRCIHRFSGNPAEWAAFLRSACQNYKLTFDEQVLVYAQRPDATAVLEIEKWNRRFGRWVNRGATGIAVFDREHPGKQRLKYYFDISDTHESDMACPVPVWKIKPKYEADIAETLENHFGELEDKTGLESALISAAQNAAGDNLPDYLSELLGYKPDSYLEEFDDLNIGVMYRRLVENSVAYMLLYRCGYIPDQHFTPQDFSDLFYFNTPDTINTLGVATSAISERALSTIALTVRNLQKEEKKEKRTFARKGEIGYADGTDKNLPAERNFGYDLHDEKRLPSARPAASPGTGGTPWEIRPAVPPVSERAPAGDVYQPLDYGQAERTPDGDSADSPAAGGTDHSADGKSRGRDRGTESPRPDAMGRTDEQSETGGGGNGDERADLQLSSEPAEKAGSDELPAFLDEKLIFGILKNHTDDLIYRRQQVEMFFGTHKDTAERAEYLKSAYQDRYTEVIVDGIRMGYKPVEDGLLMWEGAYASRTRESVFSWEIVAAFTAQLIDKKEYGINTSVKPMTPQDGQQFTLFDFDFGDSPIAPAEPMELPAEKEQGEALPEDTAAEEEIHSAADTPSDRPEKNDQPPAVLAPPKPKRERVRFTPLHPEIPAVQRRNFRITNYALGCGTKNDKFTNNVAAIRLLKQIEDEERLATPDEQEILSRYVGWGGLAECFDEKDSRYAELKALLTEEEFAAARASSLTAFYTPPAVIDAMYKALAQMGFQNGNLLEPSCGIGNFIGRLPQNMADSQVYGVEIDSISGRIAGQLYQNSRIAVEGFEKVDLPDSFFDVAIGNVPFGDFKVTDLRYDRNHWRIHDYFFGKTIDRLRPGGIIAFITSKGTMDKENPAVRKYLAQRADLIGAVRLPNNAFRANAGTEVTSDILFLQKRDRITDMEPDWVYLDTDENGIKMNRYFVQHPEMICGEMVMESSPYGMESTCKPFENADLSELLEEAVSNLHAEISAYEPEAMEEEEDLSIPADPEIRNFSYTLVDGKLYFRENSRMHPVTLPLTTENRVRGMVGLRDCVRQLILYQSENYPEDRIKEEQEKLNRLYDAYVKKYDRLYTCGNNLAFSDDSSYCLLCSLEVLDDEGNFKRKADMFTKRTIKPHEPVTKVDTASEALAVSISEKAGVDLPYMSALSGKTAEELTADLSGVIYRDISCGEKPEDIPAAFTDLDRFPFVTADEYLSGNVRRKLRMARALYEVLPAEKKPLIAGNITALEVVQPVDLTAGDIGVRISSSWIPVDVYKQFIFELVGTSPKARERMDVLYSASTGQWNVTFKHADAGNIKAVTTYGTKRVNAYQIFEHTLNQKEVRIFDTVIEDEKEKPVLNPRETAIAQDRQELMKSRFAEWVWQDIDRRERLCRIYNETFNSIRPREYDGQHIRFTGMNPEITLRPHQINAIAHILYGGNTLLAHEVGAGKTFEMIAAAMEAKRLGLCSKSLVVVPNHITEQWASEWLQLYPAANILVATERDFEKHRRKKLCARIATGDYDAIIIGHSQLLKIPMSRERQEAALQRQIDEILLGIQQAQAAKCENFTIKQMERTRKSLESRLEKLNNSAERDDLVTFEELGVDRLFIDESHHFKNLFLATKMRNVGGVAQTEAQKSSDLFMKCQYLDKVTGGRGVIFATGTPISNSIVELYTIQRYLQYGLLEDMNLLHFDDWVSDFAETVTAIELSPEGSGYRPKTRLAKFYNLPELIANFKMAADIQTADTLKLPVPKANFHTEVIKPSALQQEAIKGLAERAEKVRNSSVDNMLKITNDGRKLALDMRLLNPLAPDEENSKTAVCARHVFRIWHQSAGQRSTQLVFCDLSTPKGTVELTEVNGVWTASEFQNVYDDLKLKLLNMGIPAEEIAYIHEAGTEAKKKELFAKVRSGQVRILMGSTAKMGAGTNVQDRLVALHDLDCPWRPSDLQQRLGRIVRQGNQNAEVDIYRYVTEGTFDAYLYQLVENKQKFIAQIMTSKTPVRVAEDIDETALSYAEIKALATGNPLIIEKCNLDMEVSRLNMLKANHLNQRYALEELVLRKYPAEIKELSERIAGYEKDMALLAQHPKRPGAFPAMVIFGVTYTEKEDAGRAIIDACTHMTGSDAVLLGQYRGFSLTLFYDGTANEYRVTMRGTLSHTAVLGTDVFGNITRIDNVLEGLGGKLQNVREQLADMEKQLENARAEMEIPFAKEAELQEKTARLNALNIQLNVNKKDRCVVDTVPDEADGAKAKVKAYER